MTETVPKINTEPLKIPKINTAPKRRTKQQLTAAYKHVFSTEDGKLVLHDLLRSCHALKSSYCRENTHDTAFAEGQRNVALRILGFLNVTDDGILELGKEQKSYLVGVETYDER